MQTQNAAYTHTGRRKNNEDAFGASPELGLFIVADGMGGYEGGEVASQLTIQTITEFFRRALEDEEATWPFAFDKALSFPENMVDTAVRLASQEVVHRKVGRLSQMGSTVVVLSARKDRLVLGHVGDSRIYRIRGDEVTQLTVDHSLYEELKSKGGRDMPPLEEFSHPNIITRAIGMPKTRPELMIETPRPGDIFLLCTDGLSGVLKDADIGALVQNPDLDEACKALVDAAYQKGSKDNITAILVKVLG